MKKDNNIFSFKSSVTLLLSAIISIFLFSGCKGRKITDVITPPAALINYIIKTDEYNAKAPGQWFYESSIDNFQYAKSLKPWPLAVRITDIIEKSGYVTASVNRKGIALLNTLPDIFCLENEMFSDATSGIMAEEKNSLLIHLYRNTFFPAGSSTSVFTPFAMFDPEEKKIKSADHSFPANIALFSPVELYFRDEKWYSVWKSEVQERTAFKYFIHSSPDGIDSAEISEKTFLASQLLLSASNISPFLKEIVNNVISLNNSDNYLIELTVREKEAQAFKSYLTGRVDGNAEKYEKMCAAEIGEGKYFVSYRGNIYQGDGEKLYMIDGEAALPEGLVYTALLYFQDKLYAAWEYQQFYLTGAAGLVIIDEKSIDKTKQ